MGELYPCSPSLGVFSPHLPCEIAEANFRRFQRLSSRFASTFNPFRSIFCHFESVSISLTRSRTQEFINKEVGKQHAKTEIN